MKKTIYGNVILFITCIINISQISIYHRKPPSRPRGPDHSPNNRFKGKSSSATRKVFLFNVSRETTRADISEHIRDQGVNLIDIEECTKPHNKSKCFAIEISASHFRQTMNEYFWPKDVGFRPFYPAKEKRNYGSDDDSAMSNDTVTSSELARLVEMSDRDDFTNSYS